MVLEALIDPITAEKKPWELFFIGILCSSVSLFISAQIFEKYGALVAVFLTVLACTPLVYNTMRLEEGKDALDLEEKTLLKEHSKALSFLIYLFLGVTVSFSLWFIFLPQEISMSLFSLQVETIQSINGITASAVQSSVFLKIFLNNLKVLIFCILFSFFYGAGALFVLIWNGSVISTAIGIFFRKHLSAYASSVGLSNIGAYLGFYSLGLLRYLLHGIPEITAYFIGGLAGGIISVAIAKHDFRTKNFEKILVDSSDLILLAVLFLFIAAAIEVFITPLFF